MPRTAGALPATHGRDTEALHESASPAETGAPKAGQGLCLPCRDAGLPPTQHCRDMGHCTDTELPPIGHRRDTGHCHGGDRAALPSLHCRHSSTASLALRDTKAPPIQHCRDAGAPSIIHPALHARHCHPPVPLAEREPLPTLVLRVTHCPPCTAVQTYPTGPCLPAEQRHCTAPAHCNGRHSISPLLHSH